MNARQDVFQQKLHAHLKPFRSLNTFSFHYISFIPPCNTAYLPFCYFTSPRISYCLQLPLKLYLFFLHFRLPFCSFHRLEHETRTGSRATPPGFLEPARRQQRVRALGQQIALNRNVLYANACGPQRGPLVRERGQATRAISPYMGAVTPRTNALDAPWTFRRTAILRNLRTRGGWVHDTPLPQTACR